MPSEKRNTSRWLLAMVGFIVAFAAHAARGDNDFDGDGKADILWYNSTSGTTSIWQMNGTSIVAFASLLTDPNWKVVATPDFNGDGKSDILWYNAATGTTAIWLMSGTAVVAAAVVLTDLNWKPMATPDFNGDGKADILWYNASTGTTATWLMNGTAMVGAAVLLTDSNWKVLFTADFDGDGKADILWSNNSTGATSMWLMNGTGIAGAAIILEDPAWTVVATADFNGDGKADLLWSNDSIGATSMWLMSGTTHIDAAVLLTDPAWRAVGTPDFNGDGKADILWYSRSSGTTSTWLMNGTAYVGAAVLLTDPVWRVFGTADFDGDGKSDIVWFNAATGTTSTWLMNGTSIAASAVLLVDASWTAGVGTRTLIRSVTGSAGQIYFGIAADSRGNIWVGSATTALGPRSFYGVQTIDVTGAVSNVAGGSDIGFADGAGASARFGYLRGVAAAADGSIRLADGTYSTVRKVASDGTVSTLAGASALPAGFIDGTGSMARFAHPYGIAIDASGTIYVADNDNAAVRKVSPTGVTTTLAGAGGAGPRDTTPAYVDGPSTIARFNGPLGVAVDNGGTVYVADYANHAVRKIAVNGDVSTLAGGGPDARGSANGTGAAARFNNPTGVAVDATGNVYVLDAGNLLVRKISPGGVVTTLAGSGQSGSLDGAGSAAQFRFPLGIAVDKFGNVYVTDEVPSNAGTTSTPTLRKISPSGIVSTLMR